MPHHAHRSRSITNWRSVFGRGTAFVGLGIFIVAACNTSVPLNGGDDEPGRETPSDSPTAAEVAEALKTDESFLSQIVGTQGVRGEQGEPGPAGTQGPQGEKGEQGPPGSADGIWTQLENGNVYVEDGLVGIGTTEPECALSVNGKIETLEGGFVFPDGTIQTTAATVDSNGGDLTCGDCDSFFVNEGQTSAIGTAMLQNDAVTSTKLAANTVTSAHIANDQIDVSHIANGSSTEGQVIKSVGGNVVWADDVAGGGGSLWQSGSSGVFYNSGGVGIGTSSTNTTLEVVADNSGVIFDLRSSSGVVRIRDDSPDGDSFEVDGEALFHSDIRVIDDLDVGDDVRIGGDLEVTGSKNFLIPHPLDPENQVLRHACVESWERINVYHGTATLDEDGQAVVVLPEWFEALNTHFHYQLTAIGGAMPDLHVAREIEGNEFAIAGGKSGLKVSWQVSGTRQDAYSLANPFVVETDREDLDD